MGICSSPNNQINKNPSSFQKKISSNKINGKQTIDTSQIKE